MISDRKAISTRIDGEDCVIAFEGDSTDAVGSRDATLLLDAKGGLVGVDLGGGEFSRIAVMLGAHESVASQRPARISLARGEVRIHGGKSFG